MDADPVLITAKMLDIRDTMRRFHGERYAERTEPFRDAIRRWTDESGLPMATVTMRVIELTERHSGEMDVLLAIAASADALEAHGTEN